MDGRNIKPPRFGYNSSVCMNKPDKKDYLALIELAKAEDLGKGDITSDSVIPHDYQGCGDLVFRQAGVVCGLELVPAILQSYDKVLEWHRQANDGDFATVQQVVGRIEGPLRSLLAAERVVLNFLQRLSGIATQTARYVAEVIDSDAEICDTRKTTPGWRALEKYAVRCGGGRNHRIGLFDAVLIKDNHLAALGESDWLERLAVAVAKIQERESQPDFIEVEVDTLEQLEGVLAIEGVGRILLDNMDCSQMDRAVAMRDQRCSGRQVLLEASGGITLETVGAVGRCGVDLISVGALTHSAMSLDIALDLCDFEKTGR